MRCGQWAPCFGRRCHPAWLGENYFWRRASWCDAAAKLASIKGPLSFGSSSQILRLLNGTYRGYKAHGNSPRVCWTVHSTSRASHILDSCFMHFFRFLIQQFCFSKLEAFFVDMFQECLTFQSVLVAVTSVNQLDGQLCKMCYYVALSSFEIILVDDALYTFFNAQTHSTFTLLCTGNPGLESLMPPTTLSSNLCQRALFS